MKKLLLSSSLFLSSLVCAQTTFYQLDSVNSPGSNKQGYIYNASNQHTNTQNFQFNGSTGTFALQDQLNYVYNGSGDLIEQEFLGVINGILTPNVKTLINYNAQGYISSYTNLWYDVNAQTYWNSSKTDFARDANGDVIEEYMFADQSGSWVLMGKTVYAYTNGLAMYAVNLNTVNNGNTFDSIAKQTYMYDANGSPVEQTFYSWNNGAWQGMNKMVYTNDAAGNPTQSLTYNANGSSWDEFFKEDMVYNVNNDLTSYESFMKQGNNWNPQYKLANSYDTPLLQDLIVPNDFEYNSKIDIAEFYEPFGGTGANWSLIKTNYYHYSQEQGSGGGGGGGAGLNDVENNFTSVYPNPTANELTIVAELGGISVSIVDMLGNTVEQLNLTEGINQISVRSLVSGTYFIVDASNHRTARFSVIK